ELVGGGCDSRDADVDRELDAVPGLYVIEHALPDIRECVPDVGRILVGRDVATAGDPEGRALVHVGGVVDGTHLGVDAFRVVGVRVEARTEAPVGDHAFGPRAVIL